MKYRNKKVMGDQGKADYIYPVIIIMRWVEDWIGGLFLKNRATNACFCKGWQEVWNVRVPNAWLGP